MSDLSANILSSGFIGFEPEKVPAEPLNKKAENEFKTAEVEVKAEQEIKEVAPAEVKEAVEDMNAFVQSMQRNLSFTIDEQLGEPIISITDAETDEVIRQIPSEELVVLRKKLDDVVGILFDTKV